MGKIIKVLVLDDEPIVCERLKDFLESKKMEVEAFTDSEAAILRMQERQFDVVVTDLKMNGPTGLDVLHLIRQRHPSTRGILITAYGQMEAYREAEVLRAFEIILKPFQMNDLYKTIKRAAASAAS